MRSKRKYTTKQMISYVFDKTTCLFCKIIYVFASLASIAFFYVGDHTTAILCFITAGVYLNLAYIVEKEVDDYLK